LKILDNQRESQGKERKEKKKVVGAKLMINKPHAPFGYREATKMV